MGLALADLMVARLLPAGSPLTVAVDDTLFKRSGKKVFGVAWHHDGAAKGPKPIGFGREPGGRCVGRPAVAVSFAPAAETLAYFAANPLPLTASAALQVLSVACFAVFVAAVAPPC